MHGACYCPRNRKWRTSFHGRVFFAWLHRIPGLPAAAQPTCCTICAGWAASLVSPDPVWPCKKRTSVKEVRFFCFVGSSEAATAPGSGLHARGGLQEHPGRPGCLFLPRRDSPTCSRNSWKRASSEAGALDADQHLVVGAPVAVMEQRDVPGRVEHACGCPSAHPGAREIRIAAGARQWPRCCCRLPCSARALATKLWVRSMASKPLFHQFGGNFPALALLHGCRRTRGHACCCSCGS